MSGIAHILRPLQGSSLSPAEADEIIALVKSRVRLLPAETFQVTVTVSSDDLLDVLAWHEGDAGGWVAHEFTGNNKQWLARYDAFVGANRDDCWHLMPPSLQWAVHEFENRGAGPLRGALDTMSVRCRPLTDAPVVVRCGAIDPDEGACIVESDPRGIHPGEHFYSMAKI
ncbi:hypothetical protein B7R22_17060 [Subtercola boreus]|uniref:Uncharacterized protein n=1 Tax=Subtercola boreus TaxID=120213 RepID=A0A3E0VRF0_9MICO|nr:hypothetical protein [Subtercola boreus]RFA12140.1 hypothetical protein B7R22_17060 [Subtercola boreus]